MHSHSHAPWIYQLESFLFNLLGLAQTSFYTNQLFYQPASTTQTTFCTSQLLQKPRLHQPALHKPTLRHTRFYTNHLLLHQPAFTSQLFFTHILFLHKPAFTQTTFYTNQLLQPSFCTHHFLDKQTFYIQQPALHNPCFGPGGMLQAVKKNQLTQ